MTPFFCKPFHRQGKVYRHVIDKDTGEIIASEEFYPVDACKVGAEFSAAALEAFNFNRQRSSYGDGGA